MDVTTISGINNFSLYIYNDSKYFFFGDLHGNNLNNCDNQYHCDYFNYDFSEPMTYNTSCTTIGPLLFYWLNYNFNNNISTKFYLEKSYQENDIDPVFNTLIKRRNQNNYDTLATIFPGDMSWLQLTAYLAPTFPIKSDNVDIRFLNHQRVSPFHFQFLYNIDVNRSELNNFIKIMVANYKYILLSILTDYNLDKLYNFILSKLTGKFKKAFINHIALSNQLVNHQHIVGKTLSDLAIVNPKLSQSIIDFIVLLADEHMQGVNVDVNLDLQTFLNHYITFFTVLAAYTMDAYVLAKMFLDNSDEVIIYTGSAHIEIYNLFFQNYLNVTPIYESPIINDNKCITFNDLPTYLDIKNFRY